MSLAKKGAVFALLLGFVGLLQNSPVQAGPAAVSPEELQSVISLSISRVEEFAFIQKAAKKMGLRVWLFGGTAAGFAHYVKWDLQRQRGDARFQPDRFDYDYTNIYRSNQDLDIVVDGSPEKASILQNMLAAKFPHFQGSKQAWEVRSLTQSTGSPGSPGYKEALLNSSDFINQHTDSNSTGMIELTASSKPIVRDLRNWDSDKPHFLSDVAEGKIHFYFSSRHFETSRAKAGLNPPIFSAIRALTKAFQYELGLKPEQWNLIQKIIDDFDVHKDLQNQYTRDWVEKNGKKLIQNTVNIEYAWNILEKLGLRQKLISVSNNPEKLESLAWWMSKEPLRSTPIGLGHGKTAAEIAHELGQKELIVAHATNNFMAYESITRAHTGDPNVLSSRRGFPGESAGYGDGFYTQLGRTGAVGTGFNIRFIINPKAREGKDFLRVPDVGYFVILNKKALRVIPESLQVDPLDFFERIDDGFVFSFDDTALYEKVKRRVLNKIRASDEQLQKVVDLVRARIRQSDNVTPVMKAWFELPLSSSQPELFDEFLAKFDQNFGSLPIVLNVLENNPDYYKDPHIGSYFSKILPQELSSVGMPPALKSKLMTAIPKLKNHSEFGSIVKGMILNGGNGGIFHNYEVAKDVLSDPHWVSMKEGPELVRLIMEHEWNGSNYAIAEFVLSNPEWAENPEGPRLLQELMTVFFPASMKGYRSHTWGLIDQHVLSKKQWKKALGPMVGGRSLNALKLEAVMRQILAIKSCTGQLSGLE